LSSRRDSYRGMLCSESDSCHHERALPGMLEGFEDDWLNSSVFVHVTQYTVNLPFVQQPSRGASWGHFGLFAKAGQPVSQLQ
jgi:hypothetical protein